MGNGLESKIAFTDVLYVANIMQVFKTKCNITTAQTVVRRWMKERKKMSRYIDANATLNIIKKYLYETALNNFTTDRKVSDICENIAIHRIATWIDEVPTADVVEVVRCKNCKHSKTANYISAKCPYFCRLMANCHSGDFFCSMGERREE